MHEYLTLIQEFLKISPAETNQWWFIIILLTGLIIGSYLNVVIYRGSAKYLTNETKYKGKLDTCHPKHSFCPQCLHKLSWSENIPLISWLLQGAKCRHCKSPIPIQYPLVEALNAFSWLLLWKICPNLGQFLTYSLFFSILISVTAIDIKTLRIPNKITLTGILILLVMGLVISPSQMTNNFIAVFAAGLLGIALVELGKLLFGNKTVKLKTLTEFKLDQKNKLLVIQDEGKALEESEPLNTHELFVRESDSITICGEINNVTKSNKEENYSLVLKKDEAYITIKSKSSPPYREVIPKDTIISGSIKTITLPQEALGMGDVKLLMLIAAALGFPNFVHAMTLAAIAGLAYALALRIVAIAKKGNAPNLIAFGPWLSFASVVIVIYTTIKSS